MKKIINKKVYDTETAESLASYASDHGYNDLDWMSEELFRKKSGEFFIYGEGGARTRYAEPRGDGGWCGGCKIIPISYKEAEVWAEKNLSADEYQKIFGVIDDDTDCTLNAVIPKSAYDLLRRKSSETGRSMAKIVAEIIIEKLGANNAD